MDSGMILLTEIIQGDSLKENVYIFSQVPSLETNEAQERLKGLRIL